MGFLPWIEYTMISPQYHLGRHAHEVYVGKSRVVIAHFLIFVTIPLATISKVEGEFAMNNKPINRIITGQYPVVGMRRAKMVDVPILKTLIEESFRAAANGHYTPRQIENALQSIARVDEALIEGGTLYIATSGGEIVGLGGWSSRNARYLSDPDAAVARETVDPAKTSAHLRSYYVRPHWTRMGIANLLLEDSVAAAKQAGFKRMDVLSTKMSLPFFVAKGLQVKGETEIILPDDVHLPMTQLTMGID